MNEDDLLPPTISIRKPAKPTTNTSSNEILKAYQVNAYKYVNKTYENRGKVGLALLSSKSGSNFNLLLYGKGNLHITQAYVNADFEITSSEELYVNFYDIKSENWSLRFDISDQFTDFLSRMCIYKMMSSNKSDLVTIDIKSGSGAKVQETDMCELEITINSIKNFDINTVIYSSYPNDTIRTQVGSNKLMLAIERGLIGMSKGGYRVIAVPYKSALTKGGSVSIPADTNILVYIRLIRLKPKIERPSPKVDINKDDDIMLPDIDVKSEQEIESSSSKKDELLKKLEKMVKPIFPVNSEPIINDSPLKNYNNNQLNALHNNEMYLQNQYPYNNQLLPFHSTNPSQITLNNQPHLMQQQINPPFVPTQNLSSHTDFTVLFTETRQNNTEMRVALSKLQDKMDRIFEKIETKTVSNQQSVTRFMDAESVYENIKRIINENESLKSECAQKSDVIEKQNKRISELQKSTQLYLEESHDVLKRTSVSFSNNATEHEKRILQLEEEKLNLIRNLSQKTSEVSQTEMKLEQVTANAQTYRLKSLEFNDQITKLSEENGDLKLKNRSLLTELNDMKTARSSDSIQQEEFENRQKQWIEDENSYKKTIETLKTSVNQSKDRLNKIRSDCDVEINDIRQQYIQEIEEWKNKLKTERQRITNKSSDLQAEIDQINQSWEERFEEYRKTETSSSAKLKERNNQLTIENANLNREIDKIKDELSLIGDLQSNETSELKIKNKTLSNQIFELQMKNKTLIDQSNELENRLVESRNNLQMEIVSMKEENQKLNSINTNYENMRLKNEDLEREMKILIKEHGDVSSSKNENTPELKVNIEEKIKKIMNDVFKKIKQEIDGENTYLGKEVVNKCMIIIRDSTMEIIGPTNNKSDDETSESGTEDEEEEEEEEVEDIPSSNDELKLSEIQNVENIEKIAEIIQENTQFEEPSVEILNSLVSKLNLVEPETRYLEENPEKLLTDENLNHPIKDNSDYLENNNDNNIVNHLNHDKPENEILEILSTENSVAIEITNTEYDDDIELLDNSKTQNITPEPIKYDELDQSNILGMTKVEETDLISNINDNETIATKVEEKKNNYSSDDNDDNDSTDFFKNLNPKAKISEAQKNPVNKKFASDDDLSWLHDESEVNS